MAFRKNRSVAGRLGLWIGLCLLFTSGTKSISSESDDSDALARPASVQRIRSGVELLNRRYWSPTLGIWLDRPGDDLRAHYEGRLNPPWWSSANAVEVLLDFMTLTGNSDYEAEISQLYELNRDRRSTAPRVVAELKRRNQWSAKDEEKWNRGQAEAAARIRDPKLSGAPAGGTEYYTQFRNEYLDDSGWWGVAWLKMYDRTHDAKYLATARAIHAHMAENWRPAKNGGVMWCEDADKQIPNAITNSLFLVLSARLYQRTTEPQYLKWASETLDWFHAKALYDGTGVVDVPGHHGDYWTYNQGAFIGGLTALFQATGREEYLEEAAKVAESVLNRAGLTQPDGVIIEKLGTKGWDPGLFKGIMVRYLAGLRDVLNARKIHPETALEIDRCIRSSAVSLLRHSVSPDGEYTAEWHSGAKDRSANFNTHTSALAALVAVLRDERK
jgi:predicted alpha-1,6-mannanase (GH76 family)